MLALYLIIKSFKVRQRNFFILTGLLAITGAIAASLFVWYGFQLDKKIAGLPTFLEASPCINPKDTSPICT